MTPEPRPRRAGRLRRGLAPALVALVGVGLLVLDRWVRATDPAWAEGEQLLPDRVGWVVAVLVLLQAVVLAVGTARLPAALVAVAVLDAGVLALSGGQQSASGIAVMVAVYRLVRSGAPAAWRWTAGVAGASGVAGALAVASGPPGTARWAVPLAATGVLVSFALPAVVAGYVLTRARLVAALRERAELAEREQEAAAREAVQRERTAMARELHDIAAHHISGIVLSAQAASALLRTDPARAGGYVVTVREEAQRTLAGLRQAVGLLREQGPGETAPVPDLEQLPGLVASVRETGDRVDLHVEGDPVPLGPLAGTAAYRMVQESLTNARNHAPGAPVEVLVRHHRAGVELTVTSGAAAVDAAGDGAGAGGAGAGGVGAGAWGAGGAAPAPAASRGGGHGLTGMRERATLLGGDLLAGPTADGGWRNVLRLPAPDPEPTPGPRPDPAPAPAPDPQEVP